MKKLPEGLTAYSQTPVFSEATVPDGLRKDHKTKAGVWAVIHVVRGRLRYIVPSLGEDRVLDPENDGIVVPDTLHHVAPDGPVTFYVEFWQEPEKPVGTAG